MRARPDAVSGALLAARVLAAGALALLAAGAVLSLLHLVQLVTGPVDSETTYHHTQIVVPALAAVAFSSCFAIWGLGTGAPRRVLAGAGGIAFASAILMALIEDVESSSSAYIWYYRALFVLVLGLAGAVVLVGWRLRSTEPRNV